MTLNLTAGSGSVARSLIKRMRRLPLEVRVEIESQRECFTAHTRDLSPSGLSVVCAKKLEHGTPLNVLLYLPVDKEYELIKIHSEAIWCEEQQGLYAVGTAFRKFAPGDERRLKAFFLDNLREKSVLKPRSTKATH